MSELDDALAANRRFYEIIFNLDDDEMKNFWHDSPDVVCVHPNWPPHTGFERIQRGWRDIFSNSNEIDIRPSEETAVLFGDHAAVFCKESIETRIVGTDIKTEGYATNLFRRMNGVWKIFHHHSSPVQPSTEKLESSPWMPHLEGDGERNVSGS